MGFWRELQRRRVHRMAGFYVVGAWLIIQVADVFFPAWGLPDTAVRFLIVAAMLCFPIALVFSWIFDISTSGIVKTEPADPGDIFDNSLKRTDYVVLVALLAIGAAIVFGSLQRIIQEVDGVVATVEKIANSVAILPFANLDTNPDTGYFSDGVSEEILHRLSSLNALHVLSRASSFAFRDSNEGPVRISEILGVKYLLHGSVRRDKNLVRVTAYLTDDTGHQLWSETFDRELDGIFKIQSEIANTVARHIEREIVPPAELPVGRTTTNMEAFDAYLVGRAFVNARTRGWQDKATAAFEKAIRLDENYAPPYAGLAVALLINNPDWENVRESAGRVAQTAIELDPELAEGHAALGLTLLDHAILLGHTENRLERAERSLRHALELDPSLSIAYNWLSIVLLEQGRVEEANAVQERGLLVDPLNPILSVNIANRIKTLGERERERAEQLLLRLTHLPDPAEIALYRLAGLYADTGEFDKGLHAVKEYALAYIEYPGATISIAGTYERLGLHKDADYWMAIALAHTPQPAQRFNFRAWQFLVRGDSAGVRTEIDKLRSALGTDIDGLQGGHAAGYASANILVGNFDVGIDVFEKTFDFESLSTLQHPAAFRQGLEFSHVLAYAYQQVGRDDEAHVLLTRVHEQLNVLLVERNMDYGPLHLLFAQNFGLRGDFDAAADAMEAAIDAGWLQYIPVLNDPTWAKTIAGPRIARMLEDVKVELERQLVLVEQADAEHDFRAEYAAMRNALGT